MKWLITILLSCNLCFLVGCKMENALTEYYTSRHPIINEVMTNPASGKLPSYEWVELYNPSDVAIQLSDYTFYYNNRSFAMPDLFLPAKQYVIISSASDAHRLEPYGNTIGLQGWPRMSNAGGRLCLSHKELGSVDEVAYKSSWFDSVEKQRGGWSLERINPLFGCNPKQAWAESVDDHGGTPGKQNSVHNAGRKPKLEIKDVQLEDELIRLTLNIDTEGMLTIHQASLNYGDETITLYTDVDGNMLLLKPNTSVSSGVPYQLVIQGTFCDQSVELTTPILWQSHLAFNDVVINEILFNPKSDVPRFVEIYNRSDQIVNLQGWRLGNRLLAFNPLFLRPKSYSVITTDIEKLSAAYPSAVMENAIELKSLPSHNSKQGIVTLYNGEQLMDSLYYNESMHQPLLRDTRGISLERKSPDKPTNEIGNFHSASTFSEGATPGYENSQSRAGTIMENRMFLSSRTYHVDRSPWFIHYEFIEENAMLNVRIYDDKGRVVRHLLRNQSVGHVGKIGWDGRNDKEQNVKSGIYIAWLEMYNHLGTRKVFKENFALRR